MEVEEKSEQTPKEKMSLSFLLEAALPLYKLQEYDYVPWCDPDRNEYAEVIMKAFLEILPHINYINVLHGFSATCNYQISAYMSALEELQKIHSNPEQYEKQQQIEEEEIAKEMAELEQEAKEMEAFMAEMEKQEEEEERERFEEALRRKKSEYRSAFFGYLNKSRNDE